MPPFGTVSRRELIAALRALGFSGPHQGGRHQFMQRGSVTVIIPNPHGSDISVNLLARLLRRGTDHRLSWSVSPYSFTTVTFENPSSLLGGTSRAAICASTSSGTIRFRRRFRSWHTSIGTSKKIASTTQP